MSACTILGSVDVRPSPSCVDKPACCWPTSSCSFTRGGGALACEPSDVMDVAADGPGEEDAREVAWEWTLCGDG